MFLARRFLSPWWRRRYVTKKCRFLQQPHGVTSQKTTFSIIIYTLVFKVTESRYTQLQCLWLYSFHFQLRYTCVNSLCFLLVTGFIKIYLKSEHFGRTNNYRAHWLSAVLSVPTCKARYHPWVSHRSYPCHPKHWSPPGWWPLSIPVILVPALHCICCLSEIKKIILIYAKYTCKTQVFKIVKQCCF
jgi:hypothetical protein